ncbi:MAG: hypothetical protein F6K41_13990 [Symploca sp. SIO3E6]|nr:hypothetical protein [Caldora sp. SIO3E6]
MPQINGELKLRQTGVSPKCDRLSKKTRLAQEVMEKKTLKENKQPKTEKTPVGGSTKITISHLSEEELEQVAGAGFVRVHPRRWY